MKTDLIAIAFASLVLGTVLALAERPSRITSIDVSGTTVRLTWDVATNRFIVDRARSVSDWPNASECIASSEGVTTNGISASGQTLASNFYRVHFGMSVVDFPDINLRREVLRKIPNKHRPANKIYDVDVEDMTTFAPGELGVVSLTGLEAMTGLTYLNLNDNPIVDGTPVGTLTNLTKLLLEETLITDWTFLSSLTNLSIVSFSYNQLVDLTPLQNLLNLTDADLTFCQITDITPLIINAQNGGLGPGDRIGLAHNPIADTNQITVLRDTYGVTVHTGW